MREDECMTARDGGRACVRDDDDDDARAVVTRWRRARVGTTGDGGAISSA